MFLCALCGERRPLYDLEKISDSSKSEGSSEAMDLNTVTGRTIGAAIDVHRALGPGLLESANAECLARELVLRKVPFSRQVSLPVEYKGQRLECAYRLDFLVADSVVLEIKSVVAIEPVHEAQLLTYMKLGGWTLGLLINFNVLTLRSGIRRRVL